MTIKLNYLAKVLAALILHSYQKYALCFTFRFPLFYSRPMEWSEEHDVLFLREMLARNVFATKKGSPARALAWEALVDSLNEIHSPKFQLKDKKAVRERWNLLRKKFSKKMSEEEKASGISVEELTEKESLIEELVEREDTIHAKAESASKQHLKDNETAEDIRKKRWRALKRPRNSIQTKVELLQNVVSRDVQNHWSTFCEKKLRLTAKLDNRSYVRNNRNSQVIW